MTDKPKINKQRKVYADVLRVLSMLAIIVLHSSSPLLYEFGEAAPSDWWTAHFFNSATRWGTIVFLMLSGIFMLNPKREVPIFSFLKGRFQRIIIPFLSWSVIYLLLVHFSEIAATQNLPIGKMLLLFLTGESYTHLWFVYMIFALYLITPMLKVYVAHASERNFLYFFGFWLLTNSVLQIFHFFDITLSIESYLELTGYVGVYVGGYYLDQKERIPYPKLIYGLAISGFLMTFFGTYYMCVHKNGFDGFFFYRLYPNIILMALGVFVFFKQQINWQKIIIPQGRLHRLLIRFSLLSYGIYLAHALFLVLFRQGYLGLQLSQNSLLNYPIPAFLGIPLLAGAVLLSCFGLMWLLRKNRWTSRLLS